MKYAVINIVGAQYKVTEGDKIDVKGYLGKKGEEIEIGEVLLLADGGKINFGKPVLKNIKVKAQILEQGLGEKVIVSKFKAKTGYRRRTGFRPKETYLQIKQISS